jgi:5-(aminomethyl)-3-furanmethanol phosphate kinase
MRCLIKVGGSLTRRKGALKRLLDAIVGSSGEHEIILVAGGGEAADLVREMDGRFGLDPAVSHAMALAAMDMLGYLIAGHSDALKAVDVADAAWTKSKIQVLIPSRYILGSGMEASWDNTSDSVAAYIAGALGADELILLKSVDGVFDRDPESGLGARLIRRLTTGGLASLGETCVDRNLHGFLAGYKLRCVILNGAKPGRVRDYLSEGVADGTIISDDETPDKPGGRGRGREGRKGRSGHRRREKPV